MYNLFQPETKFTDPDQLQFCLPISEYEFWYCEINQSKIVLEGDRDIETIFDKYAGQPEKLLEDADTNLHVREFIINTRNWITAEIDVREITEEEKKNLLSIFGDSANNFANDKERNQMIAEMYFEQNINEFG